MAKKKDNSRWKDPAKDTRSNEELFAASLKGHYDAEEPWDSVRVLRLRGTKDVFLLAKDRLRSKRPVERARALDVLAQLGVSTGKPLRPFRNQSVPLVIKAMDDQSARVVHSAAWALAHLNGNQARARMIKAKRHPRSEVRHAVAVGLGGPKDPAAIRTLIELMEDKDKHVRDWATFSMSLSWPAVADSPAIRKALRKRLDDSFANARAEAIWGLARRRDREGLRLLLRRLNSRSWTSGDEMAAMETLNLSEGVPIEKLRVGISKLLAKAK